MSKKVGGRVVVGAVALAVVVVVVAVVVVLTTTGGDDSAARRGGSALPSPTASPVQTAPGGGNVSQTIAPGKPGRTVKAGISKVARLDGGVRVRVLSTRSTTTTSQAPGESGGPVLVARVEVVNGSARTLDLGGAYVTLLYGDDRVAEPSASAPTSPFRGQLRPGGVARGVYVYRLPRKDRSSISLVVQTGTDAGVARFVS